MSTLLAITGHHVGRRFSLGDLTRLGRAPDNEIVLPGNLVSRYHAEIERSGAGHVITDLESKNGIFVNDEPANNYRLKRGDRVGVGENTLVFDAPQELKTARFTNTLVHLDPDMDDTMRVVERRSRPDAGGGEATALLLKLAQIFDASSADLPDVLETMLRNLMDMFGATAGSILLKSRDDEIVPLTAIAEENELHLSRAAAQRALVEGNAVLTSSLFISPEDHEPDRRARKAMIVPMFHQEEVFGAIHLERPESSDYALKDAQFLEALSRLVSGPIRQAIRIDQLAQLNSEPAAAIIGESTALKDLRAQIKRIASTESTVLITGETGTGKELVARSIHEQSSRAGGPMIAINCAAIPGQLLESEFFGYERGAFTGADSMKRGRFEIADEGTLFLDEIGELAIDLQPKLLRFLEERIYYRVGGLRPIQTDVRIIAATNRNLEQAVEQGEFREDLLYRLHVIKLQLPPLRSRREDIHLILNHHARLIATRVGKPYVGVDDEAWAVLESYPWPGNVRELLQSIERALIMSDDGTLQAEHFQLPNTGEFDPQTGALVTKTDGPKSKKKAGDSAPPSLAETEKSAILKALKFSKGSRARAAEVLQIHRNTLRNKMKEYGIKG